MSYFLNKIWCVIKPIMCPGISWNLIFVPLIHFIKIKTSSNLSKEPLTYLDGSFDDCASYDCAVAVPSPYLYAVVDAVINLTDDGWQSASGSCVAYVAVASSLRYYYCCLDTYRNLKWLYKTMEDQFNCNICINELDETKVSAEWQNCSTEHMNNLKGLFFLYKYYGIIM